MATKKGSSKAKAKPAGKTTSRLATLKNLITGVTGSAKKAGKKPSTGKAAAPRAKANAAKGTAKAASKITSKVKGASGKAIAAEKSSSGKTLKGADAPAVTRGATGKNRDGKRAPKSPSSVSKRNALGGIVGSTGYGTSLIDSLRGGGEGALDITAESVCREVACEGLATTVGYCRMHYIKNWKKIKRKELILREHKLNQYIEELVVKYPEKYIEAIRQDLASDKDFAKVISDLDLDESVDDFDVENESVDSLIDHIKRDFEDDSEGF